MVVEEKAGAFPHVRALGAREPDVKKEGERGRGGKKKKKRRRRREGRSDSAFDTASPLPSWEGGHREREKGVWVGENREARLAHKRPRRLLAPGLETRAARWHPRRKLSPWRGRCCGFPPPHPPPPLSPQNPSQDAGASLAARPAPTSKKKKTPESFCVWLRSAAGTGKAAPAVGTHNPGEGRGKGKGKKKKALQGRRSRA